MSISKETLELLKEKQFRWDIHLKQKSVEDMMHFHRFIEVAEVAPDFVVENGK